MVKSEDYIFQMVLETFEQVEESSNVLAFRSKETEGQHLQSEMSFENMSAGYDPVRKCVILKFEGEVVEIPSSWGPFKSANWSLDSAWRRVVGAKNDQDNLLEALGALTKKSLKEFVFTFRDGRLEVSWEFETSLSSAA